LPRCWVLKTNELSIRGVPDFLICLNGFFIALELKVDTNKTDRLQEYNLAKISESGGISLVVYPETWQKDYELLKEIASLPVSSYRLTIANNREKQREQ
jgi:hypothetical protein